MDLDEKQSRRRPFSVTLLVVVVLIFTSLSWARLIESICLWSFLIALPLTVPPLYLALSGALWGMVGLPLVWGLFWGRKWALPTVRFAGLAYALYYWFDRLLVAQRTAISERWSFAVTLTLLLMAFTFWILNRKKVRNFFTGAQTDSF